MLAVRRAVLLAWSAVACLGLAAPIRNVIVSGGTHGNEYTGVYVIDRLEARAEELRRTYPSLELKTLLANPRAHTANQRFIDADLNRMFTADALADVGGASYEASRGQAIAAKYGPKGAGAATDLCVDLHTTTANMGCTIIVDSWCVLAQRTAAYLLSRWEEACEADAAAALEAADAGAARAAAAARCHQIYVFLHDGLSQMETPYLCSFARNGLQIEVGPTPQGMLRADVVATTERALRLVLEYQELCNSGRAPDLPAEIQVYLDKGKVPWDAGREGSSLPGAIVHAGLQDRDFEALRAGDVLFERLDGSLVTYDGANGDVVYPVFINEAAYYYAESGRGVRMTQRVAWPVPAASE